MKNLFKYISVISLFILLFSTTCLATGIDMNLQSNEDVENGSQVTQTQQQTSNLNQPGSTTVSTSNSSSIDDGFTLTNIINIFIVVVGVVLILLGLAILVRLKY